MTMDYSTTATAISKPFTSATQTLDRDIKQQYKYVFFPISMWFSCSCVSFNRFLLISIGFICAKKYLDN